MNSFNGNRVTDYLDVDKVADMMLSTYDFKLEDDFRLTWHGERMTDGGCYALRQYLPTSSDIHPDPEWLTALEISLKLKLMAKASNDTEYTNLKLRGFMSYLDRFNNYSDDTQDILRDAYKVYADYERFTIEKYPRYSWDDFTDMWKFSGHELRVNGVQVIR